MSHKTKATHTLRRILSVALLVAGLSVTWAWGQVAQLAEPQATEAEPLATVLYAAWQPSFAENTTFFRSIDDGGTWQPVVLPEGTIPVTWAQDGGQRLAVAVDNGSLLHSEDRGESWTVVAENLPILSLVWGEEGDLYLGTDGQGVHHLATDGTLTTLTATQDELAQASVEHLALVDGRLYAATPTVLFYTDVADPTSGGETWTKSLPVPGPISALAATGRETVYVGTETVGVYKSTNAGRTWEPVLDGLGLAAGQMVKITALRADPEVPGVLYASVGHVLGGTQVHFSAEGTFVLLDGAATWQRLAGPAFPDARQASDLAITPGKPLYVQAVTATGLQAYEPDVASALAALESDDLQARVMATRVLGFAQSQDVGEMLLAALADSEPAVSQASADALGWFDDPATASGLLVALEHPSEQVRLNAARALGLMGVEAAVAPLRSMLMLGQDSAVTVAAEALAHIGSPAATDALLTALADPYLSPRRHAAMAVLETMGENAVGPLTEMLASRDGYARRNAAQALGWIGLPSATPALVEGLKDKNAAVRAEVAWALGEIGDPAARTALERTQARDGSTAVQAAAGMALSRIKDQPATQGTTASIRWPTTWAQTLNRLQALRWLVLAASLLGAAWLALGSTRLSPAPALQRIGRQ